MVGKGLIMLNLLKFKRKQKTETFHLKCNLMNVIAFDFLVPGASNFQKILKSLSAHGSLAIWFNDFLFCRSHLIGTL